MNRISRFLIRALCDAFSLAAGSPTSRYSPLFRVFKAYPSGIRNP
ncbi:hypothetical protein BH23GEM6_BH23GEM6_16630 [soil metagenome]